jgi:Protein of unknown function (DUF1203)
MHNFHLRPISDHIARQVRETLKSPQYGHPAHVEVATGYGPCRSCLRTFVQGQENRILFTYNPFEGLSSFPSPGPIFIHEQACAPFSPNDELDSALRKIPLVLEGFGLNRSLIGEKRFTDGNFEGRVEELFDNPQVDYIHLRNGEAGCFIARIERVKSGSARVDYCEKALG